MADIQGNIIKVDSLVKQLNDTFAKHISYLDSAADSLNRYGTTAKLPSEYINNLKSIDNHQKNIVKSTKELEREQKKLQKERLADLRLQKKREQAFDKYERQLEREQRLLEKTQGLYNRVQRGINSVTKQYQDLAVRKELNGKLSAEEEITLGKLEAKLNKYQSALKKVDANIGKHTRNVGNYKSGFDGLGMSVTQLTREVPAFANSMQTGFMAISNNLPIFFDEISKTRKEVKALRAEGVKTRGTLGRLALAIVSWQTLLSIGVTLLTLYGKEIVEWGKGLFFGKEAVEKTSEALDKLGEETQKSIGRLKGLVEVVQNATTSEEDRLDAIIKLNREYPEFNTNILNEKDNTKLVNDEIDKYIDLLIKRGKAKAIEKDLGKKVIETIKLEEKLTKIKNKLEEKADLNKLDRLVMLSTEYKKLDNSDQRRIDMVAELDKSLSLLSSTERKYIDTNVEIIRTRDEMNKMTEELSKNYEAEEKIIEGTVKYYEELISKNNTLIKSKKTVNDLDEVRRLQQENKEYQKQIDLILNNSKKTSNLKKEKEKILKIEAKGINSFVLEIRKQITQLQEAEKAYAKNSKEAMYLRSQIEALEKALDPLDDAFKDSLNGVNDWSEAFKRGQKLMKDLQKSTETFISSFSSDFISQNPFSELMKFADGSFDLLLEGADTTEEKFAVMFNGITEAAQQTFNVLSSLSQENFTQQYESLERQKEVALQFAGESTTAREEIERQYEEKRKAIEQRQAKAKKEQALFNITVDTAQGVVAALAQANIPLSIVIGALGAAQLALVASQQIPQFWEGGIVGGSQQIMVNDDPYGKKGANYKEVVRKPNGQTLFPQGKNVKMTVPKGTEIFPTYDAFMSTLNTELGLNGIGLSTIQPNVNVNGGLNKSDLIEGLNMHGRSIVNAINNKEEYHFSLDENGFNKHIVKGNTKIEILNARVRGRGRSV